jgi:hypothetical protein
LNSHSNKFSIGSWVTIGFIGLVAFLFPVNLFGESLVRTVSLEAVAQKQKVSIPVGASVTFLNNYSQKLYQTSITTNHSGKRILSIDSFPAGQSFGLEFSKQGPYSICYSLKPEEDSAQLICIQINVVPLQAA